MPSILDALSSSSKAGGEGSILASAMMQPQNVIAITGIDAEKNKCVYVNYNTDGLNGDESYIFQGKTYSAGDVSGEEDGIKPIMDGESTMIVQSIDAMHLGILLENRVTETGVGYPHAKTLRPSSFSSLYASGLSSFTFEHDTYVSSWYGAPRDVLYVKNCRLEFDMGLRGYSISNLKALVVKNGYITENTSEKEWLYNANRLKYIVLDMDPLRITEMSPDKDAKIETLFKDDTIDSLPKTGKLYYNPAYNWPELIKNLPEGWEVYDYIPSDEEIEEAIAPLLRAPHE